MSLRDRFQAVRDVMQALSASQAAAAEAVDLLTDAEVDLVHNAARGQSPTLAIAAILYRARVRANGGSSPRRTPPEATAVESLKMPPCIATDEVPEPAGLRVYREPD